jgi:ABC-type lipoprotein release transport system permease subunit
MFDMRPKDDLVKYQRKKSAEEVYWLDAFGYGATNCDKFLFVFGLLIALTNGGVGASHAYIIAKLISSMNPYTEEHGSF